MIRFAARRILVGISMLLALTSATFLLVYASGADIARNLLGDLATPEQVAAKAAELGLDRPLATRYLDWLGGAAVGDLGVSWQNSASVIDLVVSRLPVTLSLVAATTLLALLLAGFLGVTAAVRGGWFDRVFQLVSLVASAVPSFVVAIVLVTVLAVQLRAFPATGFTSPGQDFAGWIASITLPVIALVASITATAAQQIRGSMRDALASPWVTTLRSRGLHETQILGLHALRAAAPAGLTVFSLQFVGLLSGTVVIEQVFALPGIGSLAVTATNAGDLPVVMGVVVYTTAMVAIVTILFDILGGLLIPRTRSMT